MDAKAGDEVMTPRTGKPVSAGAVDPRARLRRALRAALPCARREASRAFEERFWNESTGYLNDVVDCDHVRGTVDPTLRPNQVLALGGLARTLVAPERARRIVAVLEQELWTPLGLRTLPRWDPRYHGRYDGGPLERDRAYHQGTVWPWLLGPFVEAWVRVQGSSDEAKRVARAPSSRRSARTSPGRARARQRGRGRRRAARARRLSVPGLVARRAPAPRARRALIPGPPRSGVVLLLR
jgi:glycogen debranching enzyme